MAEKNQPEGDAPGNAAGSAAAGNAAAGNAAADNAAGRRKDGRPQAGAKAPRDPFARAANEDDDGYDPYSDRPARIEPLFERDPWA